MKSIVKAVIDWLFSVNQNKIAATKSTFCVPDAHDAAKVLKCKEWLYNYNGNAIVLEFYYIYCRESGAIKEVTDYAYSMLDIYTKKYKNTFGYTPEYECLNEKYWNENKYIGPLDNSLVREFITCR